MRADHGHDGSDDAGDAGGVPLVIKKGLSGGRSDDVRLQLSRVGVPDTLVMMIGRSVIVWPVVEVRSRVVGRVMVVMVRLWQRLLLHVIFVLVHVRHLVRRRVVVVVMTAAAAAVCCTIGRVV